MALDAPTPVPTLHVMAGLLLREDGCVLLAQRPPGKHMSGLWEFPGGKLEPGELPAQALARELLEELGITVMQATPMLCVEWQQSRPALQLDAWLVPQWQGIPQSLEGQALQWCLPAQVDPAILTPADRPLLEALRQHLAAAGSHIG